MPATSANGSCHVQQLRIRLDSPADATELQTALAAMQKRAHPDVLEFTRQFQEHMAVYEQQKAAQLDARLQLQAISRELLVRATLPVTSTCTIAWVEAALLANSFSLQLAHARLFMTCVP